MMLRMIGREPKKKNSSKQNHNKRKKIITEEILSKNNKKKRFSQSYTMYTYSFVVPLDGLVI